MNAKRATNSGAELTIIVAFATVVISILQCQSIRSTVKPIEAMAHIYKLLILLNFKKNLPNRKKFKAHSIGNAKNIL